MTAYLSLFRLKVSLMVGLSAFAGACLSDSNLSADHLYAFLCALFLSMGCSALNQFQERNEDALMKRTVKRPLPGAILTPKEVLQISALMIALSACFMALTGSLSGFFIIAGVVAVYNLVYTPLKKVTPFALLAGSVTGAVPPMLGYAALGGSLTNEKMLMLCALLYIWQTPHFAMLAERWADDYKAAGFKTLSGTYGAEKSSLFINIWLLAYVCALFFIPLAGIYCEHVSKIIHMSAAAATALLLLVFIRDSRKTFHILNLSMTFFFLLLVADRIIL